MGNRYRCYRLRKQVAKKYRVSLQERTIYITSDDAVVQNKFVMALVKEFKYQLQLTIL